MCGDFGVGFLERDVGGRDDDLLLRTFWPSVWTYACESEMGTAFGRLIQCGRHDLKSPQSVRIILIVDRAAWVDLRAFVFEHPKSKVNNWNAAR